MKYRKKPIVIDAVLWDGKTVTPELRSLYKKDRYPIVDPFGNLVLATPEGTMLGSPGDYIIRGIEGELYPCKPRIFESTYEPVEGKK